MHASQDPLLLDGWIDAIRSISHALCMFFNTRRCFDNREVQELSRPPANRERLLHPAVSQFETQRLLGLHYEPASQAQLQQPPPMLPAHQVRRFIDSRRCYVLVHYPQKTSKASSCAASASACFLSSHQFTLRWCLNVLLLQAPAQQLEMDSGPGSTFITQ